jgi:hypothetical protein
MNKLVIGLVVLFSLINNNLYSQDTIKTEFYSIRVPEKTSVKTFASTHEKLANIDAYQFIVNEKPKYILYLMSNKTNKEIVSVNIDNYKDYLFDLGDLKILGVEDLNEKIKIHFTYIDKENIKGIIYVSVNNDILNRFVFLLPNENAKEVFQKEIDKLVNSVIEIKNHW